MDAQRSANNAITHSMKVMPKALKNSTEQSFMLNKDIQAKMKALLQGPDAAKNFDKFVAAQGIDFPSRTRLDAFFTSVVQGVYSGELQFRDDFYKGVKSKDGEQIAKAITRYRDTLRKHGIERNELDLQKKGMKYLANREGLSLNDAFTKYGEMVREAARMAQFKDLLTRTSLLSGTSATSSQAAKNAMAYSAMMGATWSYMLAHERIATADRIDEKNSKEDQLSQEYNRMLARDKAASAASAANALKDSASPEAKSLNEADVKVRQLLTDFETAVIIGSAGAAPPGNPGTPGTKAGEEAPKKDEMVANPMVRKPKQPEPEVEKPSSLGGGAAVKAPKQAQQAPSEERHAELVRELRKAERKTIGPDASGKAASGTTERLMDNVAKSHGSPESLRALKQHLDNFASAIIAAAKPKEPAKAPKTAMR